MEKTQLELSKLISCVKNKNYPSQLPSAWKRLIWLLMKMNTRLKKVEGKMDKKMHKVTKQIKVAEKDVRKDKPKAALKVLKSAEKKNEKLVKIDRDVRDPMIKKCKMQMKGKKKK